MKTTIAFLCLSFASGVLLLPSAPLAAQELAQQINLEKEVEGRLSAKVGSILTKEQYRLIVNAKVNRVTEKIALEGETASQLDGSNLAKRETEASLPGFRLMEKPEEKPAETVKQNTKSKFRYDTYMKLSAVNINLILDTALEKERRDFVENIVRQDVETTLGKVAVLNIADLPLTRQAHTPWQAISGWFSDYLGKRGGTGIDLFYLGGIFLLFLLGLAALIHRLRRNQTRAAGAAGTAQASMLDAKNEEELVIEGVIDRLVESVSADALAVSCFLRQLKPESKKALSNATKTPALKAHFQQLMGNYLDTDVFNTGGSIDKKALKEQLLSIERDLERFLKIQQVSVQKSFGYLPLLLDDQISGIVEESSSKLEDLAILSKFLAKSQFDAVLERLNLDEKVELFKRMRGTPASPDQLARLDSDLRARYERLSTQGALYSKDGEEVEKEFLESDRNVSELIARLKTQNILLPTAYEKYSVTFDRLLGLDKDIVRMVLERVPNDILAKALVKQPINQVLKESLGEIRSRLIDSTKTRYTMTDRKEITKAQNEVLRVYWNMV